MSGSSIMRDAGIANLSFGLPALQRAEVCLPVGEVMYLDQVHRFALHLSQRVVHLMDACSLARGPNLCGIKELLANRAGSGKIADHSFGAAIHGGGVDQL